MCSSDLVQVIESELKETFASLVLSAGVLQEVVCRIESERDTDLWKCRPLPHLTSVSVTLIGLPIARGYLRARL